MKYFKIYNTLYVVVSEKDLKQFFKTEDSFQTAMFRIHDESIKRNCKRVRILNRSEVTNESN